MGLQFRQAMRDGWLKYIKATDAVQPEEAATGPSLGMRDGKPHLDCTLLAPSHTRAHHAVYSIGKIVCRVSEPCGYISADLVSLIRVTEAAGQRAGNYHYCRSAKPKAGLLGKHRPRSQSRALLQPRPTSHRAGSR